MRRECAANGSLEQFDGGPTGAIGRLIWYCEGKNLIATPKTQNITEVQVDAKTGKIVSTHIETPAKQAKEAQSEN